VKRLLSARTGILLGYTLVLEAMLFAAIWYWPSFAENLTALRGLAAPIPFASEYVQAVEEVGFPAYVLGQHFFKGCNAVGVAAAVLFAAPAVAGEVHRGTLEMWLARPFSRARLLLERWLLGALALTVPVFLTTLSIPVLAARVDEFEPYGPYLWCALHQALFLLAIHALTFLFSTIGSNPQRIALVMLFGVVFEFAIYMVKVATHWSLFRWNDMFVLLEIHDAGGLDGRLVLQLVLVTVTCVGASLALFQRRTP
jgi:ABC-type transport system involved in multi-copper enzyme maturation permease subunit